MSDAVVSPIAPRGAVSTPWRGRPSFALPLTYIVAAVLAATSIAGLVFGTRGLYDPEPATLPTFLAQDSMNLVVAIPLLLVSARAAGRGSLRGLLLWMGALFFLAYYSAFYVLGARFGVLFPAHAAIVSMCIYALVDLVVSVDAEVVARAFRSRTPRRAVAAFLMASSALFVLLWGIGIATTVAAGTQPSDVSRIVWSLDLVVALPPLFWAGVLLWRRRPWGYVLAGIVLPKAALVGFTLAATTWFARFWGVRASVVETLAYCVIGVVGLAFTSWYLRALPARGPEASSSAPLPASVPAGAHA